MAQLLRIRLYNDVLWCEVTQEQWDKFLRSQTRSLWIKEKTDKYDKAYPHKLRARQRVADALRSGRITKPTHCPKCGKETAPESLHAHHDRGYADPMIFVWRCNKCHKEEDFMNHKRGGGHGKHDPTTLVIRRRKVLTVGN